MEQIARKCEEETHRKTSSGDRMVAVEVKKKEVERKGQMEIQRQFENMRLTGFTCCGGNLPCWWSYVKEELGLVSGNWKVTNWTEN